METRLFHEGQTIARVSAPRGMHEIAFKAIREARKQLERYIESHSHFAATLRSYEADANAPELVRRMARTCACFDIGPMACVAGAIAQSAVEAMVAAGATCCMVDNGGDIVMMIDRPVTVGIFTGNAGVSSFGLIVQPRESLQSVCTSSGRIGHSLSFGIAHAATVISGDGYMADAAATALGNALKEKSKKAMEDALGGIMREGIEAMIGVIDDRIAMIGELPKMVPVSIDMERVASVME